MEAELTILRRTVNRLGFVLDLARARSLLLVRFIVCFCIFTQVITCTSLIRAMLYCKCGDTAMKINNIVEQLMSCPTCLAAQLR